MKYVLSLKQVLFLYSAYLKHIYCTLHTLHQSKLNIQVNNFLVKIRFNNVDKLDSFHTNTNINLAYHVFILVTQACKSTKIGFA